MSKTTDGYVPEPMTAHPHYASQADGIRQLIATEWRAVFVAEAPRLSATFRGPDESVDPFGPPFTKRTLDVKKCAGPAPFVGDPIWEDGWYVWFAAVDDLGRHVAGDATLDIIQRSAPAR